MLQKAEYIWLDGGDVSQLRSKVKVIDLVDGQKPPIWGFDGSSTLQAEGSSSDCVLFPAFTCKNPLEKNSILVLCEVLATSMKPHITNTRQACAKAAKIYENEECWFGLEQEYVLVDILTDRPAGWKLHKDPPAQGGCSRTFACLLRSRVTNVWHKRRGDVGSVGVSNRSIGSSRNF